jgi:hypothetical protein
MFFLSTSPANDLAGLNGVLSLEVVVLSLEVGLCHDHIPRDFHDRRDVLGLYRGLCRLFCPL